MNEPSTPPGRFGNNWKTRPSGLHVPAHVEMPPAKKERHKVTDWLQGIGTMVAAVIAALALLVGAWTLQGQQQINSDEMALNQEARERTQRRYVSRVTWWWEDGGLSVVVQNRSPVPLTEISVTVPTGASFEVLHGYGDHVRVEAPVLLSGDEAVPPCAAVVFGMTALHVPGETVIWDKSNAVNESKLRFWDSVSGWELGIAQPPTRVSLDDLSDRREFLSEVKSKRRELSDCGEGG